jgi:hypothetical protein
MKNRDANSRGRGADDHVEELSFDDDAPPPRPGDPLTDDEVISERRAEQAGLTGAAVTADFTADDLSPQTLIDEEGDEDEESVFADDTTENGALPADKDLRIVRGSEIGGGHGKDEAELAREQGSPG